MRKYGKYEKRPEKAVAKKPEVKSALLQTYFTSLLCLVLCVSMFLGTSFAWFTSEVNNTGNEIYIGVLDADLKLKQLNDAEETVWTSLKGADAPKIFTNAVKWEPGYTAVETLQVVNRGDLTFDYELKFISEDAELNQDLASMFEVYVCNTTGKTVELSTMEAIKQDATNWKYVGDLDQILEEGISIFEGEMVTVGEVKTTQPADNGAAETEKVWNEKGTDTYIIALHMKESATGTVNTQNIMGKSLKLNVKLIAYQRNGNGSEQDGFGNNDYDTVEFVSTPGELQAAIDKAADTVNIALIDDIKLTKEVTVAGDVTIDMNGKVLDTSALKENRPFHMAEGAKLTINAEDATFVMGGYGLVNVSGDVKNATITLNGGTYTGQLNNGALVRLREGNEKVDVTLNNITFDDEALNGYILSTQGFDGTGTLTVNGGTYATNYGFQIHNMTATLKNVTIQTNGTAVEATTNSNVTVDGCTIQVGGATVANAPAAAVAASHNGKVTVQNCTISGKVVAVYYVYNSNGTIIYEGRNNTITGVTSGQEYRNDAGNG